MNMLSGVAVCFVNIPLTSTVIASLLSLISDIFISVDERFVNALNQLSTSCPTLRDDENTEFLKAILTGYPSLLLSSTPIVPVMGYCSLPLYTEEESIAPEITSVI